MQKQINAIWAILMMTTVWLLIHSTNINEVQSNQVEVDAVVQSMILRLEAKKVEATEELFTETTSNEEGQYDNLFDELTFEEAFYLSRVKHGSGYVFTWRGNDYTTDLLEDSTHSSTIDTSSSSIMTMDIDNDSDDYGNVKWVLNADDLDDYCRTNDRDDCGVCGGSGAKKWYADRDEDGLGDISTISVSCSKPKGSVAEASTHIKIQD
tara:strand:- start:303 stop:929 length:627 start_codon:yes stop_codon:yes gene_type:complete